MVLHLQKHPKICSLSQAYKLSVVENKSNYGKEEFHD